MKARIERPAEDVPDEGEDMPRADMLRNCIAEFATEDDDDECGGSDDANEERQQDFCPLAPPEGTCLLDIIRAIERLDEGAHRRPNRTRGRVMIPKESSPPLWLLNTFASGAAMAERASVGRTEVSALMILPKRSRPKTWLMIADMDAAKIARGKIEKRMWYADSAASPAQSSWLNSLIVARATSL